MWKTTEGSTGRLIQLCLGYFVSYVATGVLVKYFLGKPELGFPGMNDFQFLAYNTFGANLTCLAVVFAKRWYRLASAQMVQIGGVSMPREYLYIIPSGVCTAIVIPTTTLMYSLPISVMVAMVIMRGSVIVISRIVDAIQIKQGILKKKVFLEENLAVLFAILAVSVHLFWEAGGFDFLQNAAAVAILSAYIAAYLVRIYIMNYYKNTRPKGAPLDNEGFFGVEQIAASFAMIIFAFLAYNATDWFGTTAKQVVLFHDAIAHPHPGWMLSASSGLAFGTVAFFSVFIFMFKGRTATFAGLVNRLTSLIAGTMATLIVYLSFGGKLPKVQDWVSLGFILVAVGFLTVAERKRARELALAKEVASIPAPAPRDVALRTNV
jgi:hypothetical protein